MIIDFCREDYEPVMEAQVIRKLSDIVPSYGRTN